MKSYEKYLNEVLVGKKEINEDFGGEREVEDVLQDYDVSPNKPMKCSCGWKGKAKDLGMNKTEELFCPDCGKTFFG